MQEWENLHSAGRTNLPGHEKAIGCSSVVCPSHFAGGQRAIKQEVQEVLHR
jgi:hypothetical protein